MGLATAHDIYKKNLQGANANDIMYQSKSWRSASEEGEWTANESPNGTSVKTFTFSPDTSEIPLTAYIIKIYINGNKRIIAGAIIAGTAFMGTVNYTTGARSITLAAAPDVGTIITMNGSIALENDNDLNITQSVELSLRVYPLHTDQKKAVRAGLERGASSDVVVTSLAVSIRITCAPSF
ncbi:MAG: hypothetical protein LBJ41_07870 [Treponema sp.]|jgi:hypothetical protein|nr:hypothetical protein [Treponema sp.]